MVGYHVLAPPSPHPAVSPCGTSQKSLSRQALPISFSVLVLQNFRSTKPDWLVLCRAPCEGPAPAGEEAGPQGGDNGGGGAQQITRGCRQQLNPKTSVLTSQSRLCKAGEHKLRSRGDAGSVLAPDRKKQWGIVHVIQAATIHASRGREAIPMVTGCRGAGSKTEGLGPFYLLPGEKGKHISRSCKASRISHCTGGEAQVGCSEAQTSSKLLDVGWEKLVSSGDGSAAPWPNQPPENRLRSLQTA